MIRSYKCVDNPSRAINKETYTNPKLMAEFAKSGRYISLPILPIISVCLGVKFENGIKALPIFEKIEEIDLQMDYENEAYKTMVKALEILDPAKTVIEIRGPLATLDNLLELTKVMRAMKKKREILNDLYDKLSDIYIDYMKKMLEKGVKVFSFSESILDPKVFGEKEIARYVDDFLEKFLKKVLLLENNYKFTFHLCPKSTFALIDLDKAYFEEIELEKPKKYIDILFSEHSLMGDRCINLADKSFDKVNKIKIGRENV